MFDYIYLYMYTNGGGERHFVELATELCICIYSRASSIPGIYIYFLNTYISLPPSPTVYYTSIYMHMVHTLAEQGGVCAAAMAGNT